MRRNGALEYLGWITKDNALKINWEGLNKEVDGASEKLYQLRKKLKEFDESKNEEDLDLAEIKKHLKKIISRDSSRLDRYSFKKYLKDLEEKTLGELVDLLEIREEVKALDKLKPYHNKDKHFFCSLSVSNYIIYRALMAIENEKFSLENVIEKKREDYGKFISIAKKYIEKDTTKAMLKKAELNGFGDFIKECYEPKDKDRQKILAEVFYKINEITIRIKGEFRKEHRFLYTKVLQDFGDNIRLCDEPFSNKPSTLSNKRNRSDHVYKLMKGLSQIIYLLYKTNRAAFFVVDCLRNPYEVLYLRREFANFFLLSFYADKEIRKNRIIDKATLPLSREEKKKVIENFEEADRRDSGKDNRGNEVLYKQDITKCIQISDIAINNEKNWFGHDIEESQEKVKAFLRKPLRILCLILSPGCTKPKSKEMFMNQAYAMAVKSNCISRQVGAVIVGRDGYVVGAGWNDKGEGKISCGLRAIRDLSSEEFVPYVKAILGKDSGEVVNKKSVKKLIKHLRKSIKGSNRPIPKDQFCFCFKDEMANKVIVKKFKDALKNINEELENSGKEEKNLSDKEIEQLVEKAQVHQLEFCLALHAEENAIIQSAKIGGMGLKGGTIYTTAEPCTLCAKKIQQIGLSKVTYTVPYPKSMPDVYLGVEREQFEGVKPRAYIKLFMPHHDQKEWQELESQNLVPMI